MYNNILLETRDKVAIITLNRPGKRNALSSKLMSELLDCLNQVKETSSISVLVIRGAGPVFCSGHDLNELVGKDSASYEATFSRSVQIMEAITNMPKVVIASTHSYVSAAGLQLAAACDLVVTSEDTFFETPGVKIGLFCITPMVSLSRSVNRKKALEMLLTGEPIDAREAERIGLVNKVVPGEKLEEATLELARKIASASIIPLQFGKKAFYTAADMDYMSAFNYAREMMVLNNLTEDAQEGMKAFLEKRSPQWTGK